MSSSGLRVVWRAEARGSARANQIERQLKRFLPAVNAAVRRFAGRHGRLADLTISFPALAVTLACAKRDDRAGAVMAAAVAGWPLDELARATGLPLWTRRLPPECFDGPVAGLPQSNDFWRRIANHLPKPHEAAAWLNAVAFAAAWGGESYGVWMAREFGTGRKELPLWRRMRDPALALWAFYSTRPDTFAHALIDRRWTPAIGFKAAVDAAYSWWTAVDLHVRLGDALIGDAWLTPGESDGYVFEPLLSAQEIAHEARAMKNCLRSFGADVSQNFARLWRIRKDGRRVAVVEIYRPRNGHILTIGQLEAARNRPAPQAVWWAAQQWLYRHNLPEVVKRATHAAPPLDAMTWRALWKPFWLEKAKVPCWLPLSPSETALNSL